MLNKVITPVSLSQITPSGVWEKVSGMLSPLLLPFIGILFFIGIWASAAKSIDTSLGEFPGPSQVWTQQKYW